MNRHNADIFYRIFRWIKISYFKYNLSDVKYNIFNMLSRPMFEVMTPAAYNLRFL